MSKGGGLASCAVAAALAVVLLASPAAAQCSGGRCSTGAWVKTVHFQMSPAAAAILPTPGGPKVVLWSAALPYTTEVSGQSMAQTAYVVMDAKALVPSDVITAHTNHDMFCPGISSSYDGSVYVSGGSGGANSDATVVSGYHPNGTWTSMPKMNIGRGYHSSTTLGNGKIFVVGGSFTGALGGKDGEVWAPGAANPWVHLYNVKPEVIYTDDQEGVYRADNHAWLFGWTGGSVFHAGPSIRMNWFGTTTPGGSSTLAGFRGSSHQMNGNAVMYDAGKILAVGGAPNYNNLPDKYHVTTVAVNLAYVITLGQPGKSVGVARTGNLNHARAFCTSVPLPNGDVLVTGGQSVPQIFQDSNATLVPELWQRASGTFRALAPSPTARTYHSVTLLLPDATVLSAGGGLCYFSNCPAEHSDGNVFSPPYLYKADGTLAARPVITAPAAALVGSSITVTSSMAVAMFSIIRFGSSTHAVDTDQRRIQLAFTRVSGSTGFRYSVKIPASSGVVPPGHWMLFGVLASGTPSVASIMRIN